ncbi:hypothetical protein JTE90_013855, partial [Oedothorax gibbosus]
SESPVPLKTSPIFITILETEASLDSVGVSKSIRIDSFIGGRPLSGSGEYDMSADHRVDEDIKL